MHPVRFARFGGLIMLALGLVSLIPSLVGSTMNLPPLDLDVSYGLFLGLFPMNILNKLTLIVFGLIGLYVSTLKGRELPASIQYSRVVMFVMGLGAILGLIPQTQTLFGYWPLFQLDVLVHGAFAASGGYFGYMLSSQVKPVTRGGPEDFRSSTVMAAQSRRSNQGPAPVRPVH